MVMLAPLRTHSMFRAAPVHSPDLKHTERCFGEILTLQGRSQSERTAKRSSSEIKVQRLLVLWPFSRPTSVKGIQRMIESGDDRRRVLIHLLAFSYAEWHA